MLNGLLLQGKLLRRRLQSSTGGVLVTIIITSGQSNLARRLHCHCTQTVQSYSPGSDNVHPHVTHASWDHLNPQPKWHLENYPFAWGDLDTHVMHDSLDQSEPTTQNPNDILIGSAVIAQRTAGCPYTSQWANPPSSKVSHPIP